MLLIALLAGACSGGDDGPVDADGDGFAAADDCDDNDENTNPDAVEICDGKDNDCDSDIDEDAADAGTWRRDADGDGFGSGDDQVNACTQPEGYAGSEGDCDDADAQVYPNRPEICDGIDNDCDDQVDENATDADLYYLDEDDDGFGVDASELLSCDDPGKGWADNTEDCDDEVATTYPGAPETCDGVDNDCDGFDEFCPEPLDGADVLFEGDGAGQMALTSVHGAGDVNDDDFGDLVITAAGDTTGGSGAGAAFVFFGEITSDRDMADADAILTGPGGAGIAGVSSTNSNDDDFSDLLIGAPGADRLYLVHGPVSGTQSLALARDAVYNGAGGVGTVRSFDGLGDFEGTGGSAFGVGEFSTDTVYVFTDDVVDALGPEDAWATFTGSGGFGAKVTAIGSHNFKVGGEFVDTIDDVAVTAETAERVYIFNGGGSGGVTDAADADATMVGDTGTGFGTSVESLQDVDADGNADIIVGAPLADGDKASAGAAYVFFGPLSGTLTTKDAGAVFLGQEPDDAAGTRVAGGRLDTGDNGDAVVFAPGNDEGGADAGAIYVVPGPFSGTTSLFTGSTKYAGGTAGEQAGLTGGTVNSLDGGSLLEIVVGTPLTASGAGKAYLLEL